MDEVLRFWFETLEPIDWYKKSASIDQTIKNTFQQTHKQVRLGETSDWRTKPEGRLAEIIVLDQFSRNMFRDCCRAVKTADIRARVLP